MSTISERVIKLASELLDIEPGNITNGSSIENDLGADSLDMVELIMCVEEEFDIEIPDTTASGFLLIQDVVDYVVEHN